MNDDTRREVIGLLFALATAYGYYFVMRHADEIEMWARIARDEGAKRWEQARAFRKDRNRVLFDAYVATKDAADGSG